MSSEKKYLNTQYENFFEKKLKKVTFETHVMVWYDMV